MSTPSPTETGPTPQAAPLGLLETIRLLRAASAALFDQTLLYAELVRVEWAEEKRRLLKMALAALFGFACLLCSLLATGAMVLASTWDSAWRIPSALLLVAVYLTGFGLAWLRLHRLSARSAQAFAATREELAADAALLRSKL